MDRNLHAVQIVIIVMQSLSARRAWIEIGSQQPAGTTRTVALRKESVDRNLAIMLTGHGLSSRSPQGERG